MWRVRAPKPILRLKRPSRSRCCTRQTGVTDPLAHRMPGNIITPSADDPHMTSARSREGAVGAAAEANLEGKTAVAAAVLRTINVGDGPVSTPHARENCHI